MKDVFGRTIQPGDIVAIGRDNRKVGLLFGVVLDPDYYYRSGNRVLTQTLLPIHFLYKNYYLSEGPRPCKNVNMMVMESGSFPKEAAAMLKEAYRRYQEAGRYEASIRYDLNLVRRIQNEVRDV